MNQGSHTSVSRSSCEVNPEAKVVGIINQNLILLCKTALRVSVPCYVFMSIQIQLHTQNGVLLLQWLRLDWGSVAAARELELAER
jgi:hypothetical protein